MGETTVTEKPKKTYWRLLIVIVLAIIIIALLLFILYSNCFFKSSNGTTSSCIVTATGVSTKGRLGNQLFLAATVIGTAKRNNCRYKFPRNLLDSDLYQLTHANLDRGDLYPDYTIKEQDEGMYTPITFPNDGRTYNLDGFYQSHLYFNTVEEDIRRMFKPHFKWLNEARKHIPQAFEDNSIGVHVRRGDYLSQQYKDRYAHPNLNYYMHGIGNIIQHIRKTNNNNNNNSINIIICSDDPKWCKEELIASLRRNYPHLNINAYVSEAGNQYVDFAILYSCHHQVMANSSYSWWTAFLKPVKDDKGIIIDRKIISPYPWYNLNGPLKGNQTENLYYPEWKIIGMIQKQDNIEREGYVYDKQRDRVLKLTDLYRDRMMTGKIGESIKQIKEYLKNDYNREEPLLYSDTPQTKESHGVNAAFIVNMDGQTDRWENSSKLLKHAGFKPIRFPAVDKKIISKFGDRKGLKELKLISENDSKLDNSATIGCGLSHMAIWSTIADADNDVCIAVFEDDIASYINSEDLKNKIKDAKDIIDKDWDFLFLGRCIDSCHESTKIIDGLYKTKRPYCTHAYIISSRGARKMLAKALYTGIDSQIVRESEVEGIKAYTFHPSIYIQDILKWNSNIRSFTSQISNCYDCDKPA